MTYSRFGRGNGWFSVFHRSVNGTNSDDVLDLSGATRGQKINAKRGDDEVIGSDFGDRINAGRGDDTVDGGAGNDRINGQSGNNVLDGGDGDDCIDASCGDDSIEGGNGNDRINAGGGDNTVSGGAGEDRIRTGHGDDDIDGGDGDDDIHAGHGDNTIQGGAGDDKIKTSHGNQVIDGGDGDDTIQTGKGDSLVRGGAGDDDIRVGRGNNTIEGGAGDDTIKGDKHGFDTAVYAGSILDFEICFTGSHADGCGGHNNWWSGHHHHHHRHHHHGHGYGHWFGHYGHHGRGWGELLTVTDLTGAEGTDSLRYIDKLEFADATILLDGSNNTPVIGVDDQSVSESGTVAFPMTIVDFDGDTVSIDSISSSAGLASVVFVESAESCMTRDRYEVVFDTNGAFEGLAVGQSVDVTVTIVIDDGEGGLVSRDVIVTVTGENDAPTLAAGALVADEDGAAVLLNLATLGDDIDSDDDGSTLVYTITGQPSEGAASLTGAQLSFDPGSDFQDLALGQTRDVTIAISATDSHGATANSTVTVTVTGTNDAPSIAVSAAAGFAEAADASAQVLADSGTVSFDDVDASDTLDVSFASNGDIAWSGGALAPAVASALEAGLSTGTSGAAAPGSIGWSYAAQAALDFLGDGETITWSYTITAADPHGATATDTLAFVITGTNDAPEINSAAVNLDLVEPIAPTDITASGVITFADADANDTAQIIAAPVVASMTDASGAPAPLPFAAAELAQIEAGLQIQSDGTWSLNLSPFLFIDQLGVGEELTLSTTVTAQDDSGAANDTSAAQPFAITIVGTNDAPLLITADTNGTVTEIADGAPGEGVDDLTVSGSISFFDADASDQHSVTVTPLGAGYLGALSVPGGNVSGPFVPLGTGGVFDWTFTVNDSDVGFLGAGQMLRQNYEITVDDGNGGTLTEVVTVEIIGSNDGPEIVVGQPGATEGTVVEAQSDADGVITDPGTPDATGQLAAFDQDSGAVLTWSGDAAGSYGSFAIDPVSGVWTYALDNGPAQELALGQTVTETFVATVSDDQGSTATQVVTITVEGANDAPTITSGAAEASGTVSAQSLSETLTAPELLADALSATNQRPLSVVQGPDGPQLQVGQAPVGVVGQFLTATEILAPGALNNTTTGSISVSLSRVISGDDDLFIGLHDGSRHLDFIATDAGNPGWGVAQSGNINALATGFQNFGPLDETAGTAAVGLSTINLVFEFNNGQQRIVLMSEDGSSQLFASSWGSFLDADAGLTLFTSPADENEEYLLGPLSYDIALPVAPSASGQITATDPDLGAVLGFSGNATGAYGVFAVDPLSGVWTYTLDNAHPDVVALAEGQPLVETFAVVVTDEHGASDTESVTVTILGNNDAPTAVNDDNAGDAVVEQGHTEPGDATASGDVLANDSDPDTGDTLTVSAVNGAAANVGVSVLGLYGALELAANGSWTYTLDDANPATEALAAGQVVTEVFSYEVSDGNGGEDTASLTITITGSEDNRPPTATSSSWTTLEDDPLVTGVVTSDPDLGLGDTLTHTIETGPSNGFVAMNPDGTYTYQPGTHFSGTDSFTYRVTDAAGESAVATETITVVAVADAPALTVLPQSGAEDQPLPIDLSASLVDLDGSESLSLVLTGFPAGATFNIGAPDGSGGWEIPNAHLQNLSTLAMTPPADWNGSFTLTVTGTATESSNSDTAISLVSAQYTVTPVNDAPVANDDSATTAEDTPLIIPEGDLLANDTDIDGDSPIVGAVDAVSAQGGSISWTPGGSLTYTPPEDYSGPDSFEYQITDGNGGVSTATVNLTVTPVNDAPEVTDTAALFSGATSDRAQIANVSGFPSSAFTMSALVRIDAPNALEHYISYASTNSSNDLLLRTNGDLLGVIAGGTYGHEVQAVGINDGNLHHIAATFDGVSTMTFYYDGAVIGTATGVSFANFADGGTLMLGHDQDSIGGGLSASQSLRGAMDNVGLWGRALSAAEIADLSNGIADKGDADLFAYWSYNTDSESFVDLSANGNDLTTVGNLPAAPIAPQPVSVVEDGSLPVSGVQVSDVDATSLQVSIQVTNGTVGFADFPGSDNLNLSISGTTEAVNETLASLVYTPNPDFHGTDTIQITVNDQGATGAGGPQSATMSIPVTVTPANDAPVADDLVIEAPESRGSTLTVTNGQLTASDIDPGDTLSWTAGTFATANGSVTIASDGSFSYTPNLGFVGVDNFTATVSDAAGATDTAEVRVEVATEQFTSPGGQQVTLDLNADATGGAPAGAMTIDLTAYQAPAVNIAIAMDASGSVGSAGWAAQVSAVQGALNDIANRFQGSGVDVDAHVFSFSGATTSGNLAIQVVDGALATPPQVYNAPGLSVADIDLDTTTVGELISDIGNMTFTTGTTPWNSTFQQAEAYFDAEFLEDGANAVNLMLFITDGQPYPTSQPWQQALANLVNQPVTVTGVPGAGTFDPTPAGMDSYTVDLQAFGVGGGINLPLLNQVDSDGTATPVNNFVALSAALSGSGLFPAELISLDVTLTADGVSQIIADETSPEVVSGPLSVDLALADIAGIEDQLGTVNEVAIAAVFDLDGNAGTTGDQVTLNSLELFTYEDAAQSFAGTSGNDLAFGSTDDDSMNGDAGDDLLLAGQGNDTLRGGADNDRLGGGAGADQFVFAAGDGIDTLLDYNVADDEIVFEGGIVFGDLTISQSGADVTIAYGADQITVENATAGDFISDEFLFV